MRIMVIKIARDWDVVITHETNVVFTTTVTFKHETCVAIVVQGTVVVINKMSYLLFIVYMSYRNIYYEGIGGWEDWGKFSSCSRSCGGGSTTRTRQCVGVNGTKAYQCFSDYSWHFNGTWHQSRSCNEKRCPS